MKTKLFGVALTLALLGVGLGASVGASAKDGDGVGNGGDIVRANYFLRGEEFLDYLRNDADGKAWVARHKIDLTKLEPTLSIKTVRVQDQKNGDPPLVDDRGSAVEALSEPGWTLLEHDPWQRHWELDDDVHFMVGHEMLRQAGIDDDDYIKSKELRPWRGKKMSLKPTRVQPAVVLAEFKFDSPHDGLKDLAQARAFCEAQRRRYAETYFFVICEIHEKNWKEKRTGTAMAVSNVNLGTMSASRSWGLYGRGGAGGDFSSTVQAPVIGQQAVPYNYTYEVSKQMYGVRVVGVGELASAPIKTLVRSEVTALGLPLIDYADATEALEACQLAVLAGQASSTEMALRYYRANCRVVPGAAQRFNYRIESKNPYFVE